MYRFRIRANNRHGRSEPSAPSEDVRISLGNADDSVAINSNQINVTPGGDFKSRFTIQEELGKGRFGIVHKVIERETGQVLAAKIVKCIKAKDKLMVCLFLE